MHHRLSIGALCWIQASLLKYGTQLRQLQLLQEDFHTANQHVGHQAADVNVDYILHFLHSHF